MKENEKRSLHMNEFDINDFSVNHEYKYKSCIVFDEQLSEDTLTRLYKNGWNVSNFNVSFKSKTIGYMTKEGITQIVFAYMFENINYVETKNINE